jgi:hypothetical protein
MTLDELVKEACLRDLTQDEVDLLCALAAKEGRTQEACLSILTAQTAAGRNNLKLAKDLRVSPRYTKTREEVRRQKEERGLAIVKLLCHYRLPFVVTNHAFERYAERHLRSEPLERAIAYLTEEAKTATPIREKTLTGDEQWVSTSGVIFVMRRDGGKSRPVCVTVLPREEDKTVGHKVRVGKPLRRRDYR